MTFQVSQAWEVSGRLKILNPDQKMKMVFHQNPGERIGNGFDVCYI